MTKLSLPAFPVAMVDGAVPEGSLMKEVHPEVTGNRGGLRSLGEFQTIVFSRVRINILINMITV